MIAACGLLLGACTKSDPGVGDETGTVKFKVTAVNSLQTRGDILTMGKDGPIPTFGKISVYAFRDNGSGTYLYEKTVELLTAPEDYNTETNSITQILPDGTFGAGNYKFVGVGRVDGDEYTLATTTQPDDAPISFDAFTASIGTQANSATNVIFAGNKTQEVLATGATIEIDISRYVAGIFLYITDVPYEISNTPVAFLRLRVSDANTSVNLSTKAGSVPIAETDYYAIDIDLTTQEIDTEHNVYAGIASTAALALVDHSQIESNYAIPVSDVTMTLELQSANGTPLKVWNVRDKEDNPTTINMAANVLLAIGVKNKADGTLGDDDTDDTTTDEDETGTDNEDDKPVSLLTDETITVNVLRNWDVVNSLDLEEAPATQP